MTKHNFTPAQSETILNALSVLLDSNINTYAHARRISELSLQVISNSIEVDESGCFDLNMPCKYLDELITNTKNLSDFFYSVGDVLYSEN